MNIADIQHVLFDLDGTLLDTARDLANAMNHTLAQYRHPPVEFDAFRLHVPTGTAAMIKHSFGITPQHSDFKPIRETFINYYRAHIAEQTVFFPKMETVLDRLDEAQLPWGIVTSKPMDLTAPLLEHFGLGKRASCIVAGDSIQHPKPHPEPLLHACQLIQIHPRHCVYVGDAEVDAQASRGAGMRSLIVLHGYRPASSDPAAWRADRLIESPLEILEWIKQP